MELGEYVEAHKPPNGFPKTGGVCKDGVGVGRGAEILIRAVDIWTKGHNMFDSLVQVSTGAIRSYVWDSLSGEERIESYLFRTKLRS